MLAIAASSYGPLARLKALEMPRPQPGPAEVQVKVIASALNPADYKVLLGKMKFLHARNFPMVVGYDFSGTVEAVGSEVREFAAGDAVFGFLPYGPGNRRGAFAEMLVANRKELALKPAGVSHEVAAASATPGLTALTALRDLGRLKGSGRVLVTGVSGGVGALGVGIARRWQAEVTAVGSPAGLEQARRMGATTLIDRNRQDVFAEAKGPFDVIFDAAAAYRWSQWSGHLKPGGAYVTTLPTLGFGIDKVRSLFSSSRAELVMVKSRSADLELLAEWLSTGLEVPLDSTLPVREVAAGLERLESGRQLGRIAIRVAGGF